MVLRSPLQLLNLFNLKLLDMLKLLYLSMQNVLDPTESILKLSARVTMTVSCVRCCHSSSVQLGKQKSLLQILHRRARRRWRMNFDRTQAWMSTSLLMLMVGGIRQVELIAHV